MRSLPESATIVVADDKAARLLSASEQMTAYSNRDYYQAQMQLDAYNALRIHCPDEFDTLQELIKSALQQAPYSVLVKGLQFDQHYRLLVALNRSLGKLVARPYDEKTPRAQLIHHVEPQTDINNQHNKGGLAKLSEKMHIDGADRRVPIRYVSMQCVRPDNQGEGRSRLLDINGVRNLLEHGGISRHQLTLLENEPVPWLLADYLGGDICWRTILTKDGLNWRRYSIDAALAKKGLKLSDILLATLAQVEQLIEQDEQYKYEFLMAPGDFLIVDNLRCLHARSKISDPATSRLMYRAWVE